MRSRCCLCVCAYVCLCIPLLLLGNGSVKFTLIVARQRLGRNVIAVTNTHATIELLGESFSMRPVSGQGKQANSSSKNCVVFLYI
jgi:hypothetical protein